MKRDIVKRYSDSIRYSKFILKKKKKEEEYEKLKKDILGYEVKPKGNVGVKKAVIVEPSLIERILEKKKKKQSVEKIDIPDLVSEMKKLSLFTETIVKLPPTSVLSAGSLALIYKIRSSRKSLIKKESDDKLENYFSDNEVTIKDLETIKFNLTESLMELDYLENDILRLFDFFIDSDEIKNILSQINKMKKEVQDKQIEVQINIESIKEKEYDDEYEMGGKSR